MANAVFDGTDAVMLSAETASGKWPREATAMMARIIVEAEANMSDAPRRRREGQITSISETICESIAHAAHQVNMTAIAVFTETGNTARLISKYRPRAPIYAFTSVPEVRNRMNLLWGVRPLHSEHAPSADDMVRAAEKSLLALGAVKNGDVVGVVAGTQLASGSTNFMRLHVVGGALGAGSRRNVGRR